MPLGLALDDRRNRHADICLLRPRRKLQRVQRFETCEAIYLGEQFQAPVNDHECVQLLERELYLAHSKLESEIAPRRVLEDQLGGVRSIFEQYRQQGRSERRE